MHFNECDEGDYRIQACAIAVAQGGYMASVQISKVRGVPVPVEVFRDEQMSDGHAWDDPERALHFAMRVAIAVTRERARLDAAAVNGKLALAS